MRFLIRPMRCLAGVIAFAAVGASGADLFVGADFAGWEMVATPAADITEVCRFLPDGTIAAKGLPVGFMSTTASYENYRLHAEWRWSGKPGNGGVLVHISSGPKDRAWPLSIQIQTKNKSVGDLLPMAGATFAEPLTSAPGASPQIKAHIATDSEKAVGEWNICDILCQDGTIEVTINGVLQNKITQATPRSGHVGFQFEGTAFELRHVTLTPLASDPATK